MYSIDCDIDAIVIHKGLSHPHEERYCGYLLPWNETCPCVNIYIQIIYQYPHPTTEVIISFHVIRTLMMTTFEVVHILGDNHNLNVYNSQTPYIQGLLQHVTVYLYSLYVNLIEISSTNSGEY